MVCTCRVHCKALGGRRPFVGAVELGHGVLDPQLQRSPVATEPPDHRRGDVVQAEHLRQLIGGALEHEVVPQIHEEAPVVHPGSLVPLIDVLVRRPRSDSILLEHDLVRAGDAHGDAFPGNDLGGAEEVENGVVRVERKVVAVESQEAALLGLCRRVGYGARQPGDDEPRAQEPRGSEHNQAKSHHNNLLSGTSPMPPLPSGSRILG